MVAKIIAKQLLFIHKPTDYEISSSINAFCDIVLPK